MINRQQQIELILETIREDFEIIGQLFKESIAQKNLNKRVLVRIKNMLENMKSVLDFTAREIFEKYCNPSKPINVYFPILHKTATDTDIENRINGLFPGLKKTAPQLFDHLFNMQPSKGINNEWLASLNNLCNSNKHVFLTVQVKKDEVINVLSVKNAKTYIWSDGLVKFDSNNGNVIIPPGGKFQITMTNDVNGVEDFWAFGWIVASLDRYSVRSSPDLSAWESDSYSLSSYVVGDFYFTDEHTAAYTLLSSFLTQVDSVYKHIFSHFL